MKLLIYSLYSSALLLGCFGYWGLFSEYGKRRFDEMAGYIPGIALIAAIMILPAAIVLNTVWFFKSRKRHNN